MPAVRSAAGLRSAAKAAAARKARTPAAALRQLSALAAERDVLQREVDRWQARYTVIRSRLAEIAEAEEHLKKVAAADDAPPAPRPAVAPPAPPAGGVRVTAFGY